jgi:hypothetical protein
MQGRNRKTVEKVMKKERRRDEGVYRRSEEKNKKPAELRWETGKDKENEKNRGFEEMNRETKKQISIAEIRKRSGMGGEQMEKGEEG